MRRATIYSQAGEETSGLKPMWSSQLLWPESLNPGPLQGKLIQAAKIRSGWGQMTKMPPLKRARISEKAYTGCEIWQKAWIFCLLKVKQPNAALVRVLKPFIKHDLASRMQIST